MISLIWDGARGGGGDNGGVEYEGNVGGSSLSPTGGGSPSYGCNTGGANSAGGEPGLPSEHSSMSMSDKKEIQQKYMNNYGKKKFYLTWKT